MAERGLIKKIIKTLKSNEGERKNFFYYNNGITIICNEVKPDTGSKKNVIKITKPQIVNGCQTVNSIFEVLNEYEKNEERNNNFQSTYVMTKIIVVKEMEKEFYRDIVKYTNSQNAINEKVFGAVNKPFVKIQENLEKKGILLLVKQSDKETFKKNYESNEAKGKLIQGANTLLNKVSQSSSMDYQFNKLQDCQIKLELLLQLMGAFERDAQFAYINKANLLKPTGNIYNDFSRTINDRYTIDEIITIILLYKKVELDRKGTNKRERHPAPYFTLNFLKVLLDKYEKKLKDFFFKDLLLIYEKVIKGLSQKYCLMEDFKGLDFHMIVRRKIDKESVKKLIDCEIKNTQQYNKTDYEELMQILNNNQ